MRVSFTRVIPRLGAGQAPSRLQFSTPSIPSIPSRSYSSLRPFSHTLTLNNNKNHRPPLSQRPKPPHSSHHNRRAFSLLPLLDASVAASQTLLTTLHTTTATPWYLTIPLFAASLSLLTRFPTM